MLAREGRSRLSERFVRRPGAVKEGDEMRAWRVVISAAVVASGLQIAAAGEEDISLFDQRGRAVAYVAADGTIYLWSGEPVAYLVRESKANAHIYDFDGDHLGWFAKGVVHDHDGDAVGATRAALRTQPELEPLKGVKSLKPLKGLRELAPLRPLFSLQWSETPLKTFLLDIEEEE
jgi:hypothetical protein